MKKNIVLYSAVVLSIVAGLVACNPTVNSTPTVYPTALVWIASNPWQIQSIDFRKTDGTDSNYSSTNTLSNSRLSFGINNSCQFIDKVNTGYYGPNNDSTIFKYFSLGIWAFDNTWTTAANAGSLDDMPDSLNYQQVISYDGGYTYTGQGVVYRCAIDELDSLNLQFHYIDTTIDQTTQNKVPILKTVTLAAVAN